MKATVKIGSIELSFCDEDVVNPDDFIPRGEYNPHNVRPWLLHDHGFTLCVVYADCLQDALDIACDNDKLERYLITQEDAHEYGLDGEEPTCAFLGNAGEPHDIDTLGYLELENPPYSFAALYNASSCRVLSHRFA